MLLYGHSYNAMVGVYVFPSAHNFQHKKKTHLVGEGGGDYYTTSY